MSEFGFNILRTEYSDLWMYYGRGTGHGHSDKLTWGFNLHGMDYTPDLGAPTSTNQNARRLAWESNTLSHNTVIVDKKRQTGREFIGNPLHFDDNGTIQLMDIDAPNTYDNTNVYRRTLMNVKMETDSDYIIDIFNVSGGSEHMYSFHGFNTCIDVNGPVISSIGTIAGNEVAFGAMVSGDENTWAYEGVGEQYLKNPRTIEMKGNDIPSLTWSNDVAFLNMKILGDREEIRIADGEKPITPYTKGELSYCLVNSKGPSSRFVSLFFTNKKLMERITNIVELSKNEEGLSAYQLQYDDGRMDTIMFSDQARSYTVDGNIDFSGFLGVIIETAYGTTIYVNDATISYQGNTVSSTPIQGVVQSFSEENLLNPEIRVKIDKRISGENLLIPEYVYVQNGDHISALKVKNFIEFNNGIYDIIIDSKSLISGYNSETKEFRYIIAKGSPIRIMQSKMQIFTN